MTSDAQQKFADTVHRLIEIASAESERLRAKATLSAADVRVVADLAQALSLLGRATRASHSPVTFATIVSRQKEG